MGQSPNATGRSAIGKAPCGNCWTPPVSAGLLDTLEGKSLHRDYVGDYIRAIKGDRTGARAFRPLAQNLNPLEGT